LGRGFWNSGHARKKLSLGELKWGWVVAREPKETMGGLQGLGGSNQVQLTRACLVNDKVWIIEVHNPDYQGASLKVHHILHRI